MQDDIKAELSVIRLSMGKRIPLKKEKRKYNTGQTKREDLTDLLKSEFQNARQFEASLLSILGKLVEPAAAAQPAAAPQSP